MSIMITYLTIFSQTFLGRTEENKGTNHIRCCGLRSNLEPSEYKDWILIYIHGRLGWRDGFRRILLKGEFGK